MTAFGHEWRSATISTSDGPLYVLALTAESLAFIASLPRDEYRVEFHQEDRSWDLHS